MEELLYIETEELLSELESKIYEKRKLEESLQKEIQEEFLDDDEENGETVDLKIEIEELNSEIKEIVNELHNRDELPYKYNDWLEREEKQDNNPIHLIDRAVKKMAILEKQKPKSEMDKEAILYDKNQLKREIVDLLEKNKDNLPERLEHLLDKYNITQKGLEMEKKELANKISKKERVCIEIDEDLKKDLEIIQFYFYRDTSKKTTKTMLKEFLEKEIKEMKRKMIEEMGR